jgi:hypothetical protein
MQAPRHKWSAEASPSIIARLNWQIIRHKRSLREDWYGYVLVLYLERPRAQFEFACALGGRF